MQETSVLLSLAAVFAAALVSPGPDVALVVRTAVHQGRRAGLLSALGLACGILVHGTLVLTGVALLLSRSPLLFDLLQLLGASYLGWLGVDSRLVTATLFVTGVVVSLPLTLIVAAACSLG